MLKAKIESWMTQFEGWLWQAESKGKSKANRTLWHGTRVLFAVIRDVFSGHITLHAMSLVYTTLLSIVPLLALSFAVLKGLGAHDRLKPLLESYLLPPLGDKAPELINNTLTYVDNIKVGGLGSLGLILLVYWVFSLVQKVERSFNEIWRVSAARSFAQRFSNYLSVIMIGPMLMVAATGATATFVSSDIVQQIIAVEPFGWLFATLSRLTPYLITIGLFTFLYIFIPNTKVKLKNGFCGALVAGIIWQTAVVVFAVTVAASTKYGEIYAGFAAGIVLLIWLYFSWLTLLIGAAVAFYSQHSQQITRNRVSIPSAELDEVTGLAMLYAVGKQFYSGGSVTFRDLESNLSTGPEVIQRIMRRLQDASIIVVAEDGSHLYPAQPFEQLSMHEVIQVLRSTKQPLPSSITQCEPAMKVLAKIEHGFDQVLERQTVADWIKQSINEETQQTIALTNNQEIKQLA